MRQYKIRTEEGTFLSDNVIIKDGYVWIGEEKKLYRVIEDGEEELQADAIISSGKIEIKACIVSSFESPDAAFRVVEHNKRFMKIALEYLENNLDKDSADNNTFQEPLDKPKTYVANYLFNYFGGDEVEGKIIAGAGIDVAIRPYKDGKLVQFQSEQDIYFSLNVKSRLLGERIIKIYLTDMITVSFDREKIYRIEIDESVKKLICEYFGWDDIKVEAVDFELDYLENKIISKPWYCGKEVFTQFITNHLDEFDISDNANAQCSSYSWLEEL